MKSAKGLCLKVFLLFAVVCINGLGVAYFAKDKIDLPSWLHDALSMSQQLVELFEIEENPSGSHLLEVESSASENKSIDIADFATHTNHVCMDKRAAPSAKTIYTWTDGKGIRHISDKPRDINGNTSVKVAGTIKPDAISINFLSQNLSYEIRANALKKVKQAMKVFAAVTPEESIVPVVAKVKSYDSKALYELNQKATAPNLSSSTGFYSASSNESSVLIRNDSQTVATITHELVHTINRHWYGQMVIWLNEGMAEYAEYPEGLHKSDWYSYLKNVQPVPLNQLLNGSRNKWRQEPKRYYATSWAFVAFIMSENKPFMSRLLLVESKNGCLELSAKDVEKLYGKSIVVMQHDFQRWMNKALR